MKLARIEVQDGARRGAEISVLIAAGSMDGHRREYISFFESLFRRSGVQTRTRGLRFSDVFESGVLFSPMLEEHSTRFMVVSGLRALLGKRSVAFLFRANEAARSAALKHRIKRLGLKILLRLSPVSVLTILPFALDERFAQVARGWIYDPQLWDIGAAVKTPLAAALRKAAGGRLLVVALGAQNTEKGFDFYARLWRDGADLRDRAYFVAAGRVGHGSQRIAAEFESAGGALVNRFIDDDELRSLYDIADVIWSCYAPSYDQASGIFGRAVQVGVPAAIRDGSYLVPLARALEHPAIPLAWDEIARSSALLLEPSRKCAAEDARKKVVRMRAVSLEALSRALGFSLNPGPP